MKKIKNIFLILTLFSSFAFANIEDELIIKAIYYTQNKNPKEASKYWKELFDVTNNEEYLIEYFYAELNYKNIKEVINELKSVLKKKKSKELYELLGSLYTKEGNVDGVIDVISKIPGKNSESLYELAYIYLLKGENKKALSIYKKLYNKEHSWRSLKKILSILIKDGKEKEAKNLLWSAIKNYKMPKEAYLVMAGLIEPKKELKKDIYIFEKLYEMTKAKEFLKQLISLYLYQKDYDKVEDILEKSEFDDKLLYELYSSRDKNAKAYIIANRLYEKTKNPKWLAEKAIQTFEIANRYKAVDKNVLQEMSKLFEKAFKAGVKDATYFNYYGYNLIDYDIDLKKGIEYVKKALELEPKNLYYLDSLLWGYYKLKDCKNAKEVLATIEKNFKNIKEKDIKKHLDVVKKCK